MKAQKVVRVEVFEAACDGEGCECGGLGCMGTVVAAVFGVEGQGADGRRYGRFTEMHRVNMTWSEGYALRHFNGWTVDAPTIHPAETVAQAVEAACMAAAGWDAQEDERRPHPRQFGGSHRAIAA
jgi:hypothetical protein